MGVVKAVKTKVAEKKIEKAAKELNVEVKPETAKKVAKAAVEKKAEVKEEL